MGDESQLSSGANAPEQQKKGGKALGCILLLLGAALSAFIANNVHGVVPGVVLGGLMGVFLALGWRMLSKK